MHLPKWLASSVTKRIAAACMVVVGIAILLESIMSVSSSRPSSAAVRHWEELHKPVLPTGFSDFRGHWQSQDIGVQIFSFGVPADRNCDDVFDDIVRRLPSFRLLERTPDEMSLRRNTDNAITPGFDEYRFVCDDSNHRVYGMFANLDTEADAHAELVKKLHEIANEKSGS